MHIDNFLSFSVVNGFFIGLFVSIVKYDTAEMILLFTLFVTAIFYIIMLIGASFFVKFFDFKKATIHKDKYDEELEEYIVEFNKREKIVRKIKEFIDSLHSGENGKTSPKERRKKAA